MAGNAYILYEVFDSEYLEEEVVPLSSGASMVRSWQELMAIAGKLLTQKLLTFSIVAQQKLPKVITNQSGTC